MATTPLQSKLQRINICCGLSAHLFGKEHTVKHRMLTGVLVMAVGVTISKLAVLFELHYVTLHFMFDGVGYMVHGIGALPFGEYLMKTEEAAEL